MFVSNVCRIIVETVSAVSYHFEVGTNDWPEQFWRVMRDRLQKDSHEDSHRWSCHITHVGPCHCRLPIECWVFLTVEYRIAGVTFGDLDKVGNPLCSFDKLIFGAPFYSRIVWDIASRSAGVSVAPSCGHLCDMTQRLKTLNQRYWRWWVRVWP